MTAFLNGRSEWIPKHVFPEGLRDEVDQVDDRTTPKDELERDLPNGLHVAEAHEQHAQEEGKPNRERDDSESDRNQVEPCRGSG